MASCWSRNAPEKNMLQIKRVFEKEEMCQKCSNFLETVNGIGQKLRKWTPPKYEIKLIKKQVNQLVHKH